MEQEKLFKCKKCSKECEMKDMETDNDEDFCCFNCFCSEYPMLEGHIAPNGEMCRLFDKNINKKF